MSAAKLTFKLAGKEYTLTSAEVEDAAKHAEPDRVDKYYVDMHGLQYPPKQVLSLALDIPVGDFISTDATRVLKKLGFKIRALDKRVGAAKTESEVLFETYLNTRGLTNWSFEPALAETKRRPDYSLDLHGMHILFEVKQFSATADDFRPGVRAYDPYAPIREKMEAGRKKFKDLKEYCCCLVLYNREKFLVDLDWQFIYGALLGNLAIRMPVDPVRGGLTDREEVGFFGGGGKGIRYSNDIPPRPLQPQNQTISAIVVLEQMPIGRRRLQIAITAREKEMGRTLTLEEHLDLIARAQGTEQDVSLSQLRVVVCENPNARIPFPRGIFYGPYDELYGLDDETGGKIVRTYVGDHVKQLELQEEQAKSKSQHTFENYLNKKARQ